MPYKIRFYPKGARKKHLLKNLGKPGAISVHSSTTYQSKSSAKKSKLFKAVKDLGYSPRVEKVRRK